MEAPQMPSHARSTSSLLLAASLALALPAAAKSEATQVKKPEAPAVAATIGAPDAKWTDTTNAAAATPEQKAQLQTGKPITVTGEVVDVSCYLQLGKRGEKHVACGTKCLQNGQPIGLVDDKGDLYVLFAEEHDPRRDGKVDLRATFVPLLAKRVTVSGIATEQKGSHGIFVAAAALKPAAPAAPAPAK
jgi:hypothetical protein